MAIWEVTPGPFLDTNGFAKYTYVCSIRHTKRECYELTHQTATMDLEVFDVSLD